MSTRPEGAPSPRRTGWLKVARGVAYWLLVLVVSLAIAVSVISYLIGRDESRLEPPDATPPTTTASPSP